MSNCTDGFRDFMINLKSKNAVISALTGQKHSSVESALAEAILKQMKKEEHHGNVYVIDRSLQLARAMKSFNKNLLKFIIRSKENRKFEEV